ncbi:hypothetical protein BDV3_006340 [Batrachochytrium dendrobatidis]
MSTLWPNNPAGHNSDTSVHANIQVTNSYNADDDADEYSDQRPLLPSYPEPASNYNHLSTHRRDCPLYQQGHRYLRSASSRSLPLLLSDSERIAASRATCETMSINVTTDSHAVTRYMTEILADLARPPLHPSLWDLLLEEFYH